MANNPNQKNRNLNEDREPMSNPTGAREKQGGSVERDIERDRQGQSGSQSGNRTGGQGGQRNDR
jgi:hypothetical protein